MRLPVDTDHLPFEVMASAGQRRQSSDTALVTVPSSHAQHGVASTVAPNDILGAMESVRSAFVGLISCLPSGSSDLSGIMHVLGLRRTLAWHVVRICRAKDALSCAEDVPGPEGIDILLKAAEAAGLPAKSIADVRMATSNMYAMVGHHARSRPALRRLVRGLSDAHEKSALASRRAAVEANRYIWGVHADVHYNGAFLFDPHRSAESSGSIDAAIIKGISGLTRSRPDVTWELNRWMNLRLTPDGKSHSPLAPTPLRPDQVTASGVPLLLDLCSQPVPDIRRSVDKDTTIVDEVMCSVVGQSGAMSLVTGELHRGMSDRHFETGDFRQCTRPRTPTDLLVAEVHFERALYPGVRCEAYYYDLICSALAFPNAVNAEPPRLNIEIDFHQYERADFAPVSLDVPRHAAIRESAYSAIGRSPADFVACIAKVSHPPVPGGLVIKIPLPRIRR